MMKLHHCSKKKAHIRKHVKIRITCYNADTVLSELDNIVDNAVTLAGIYRGAMII